MNDSWAMKQTVLFLFIIALVNMGCSTSQTPDRPQIPYKVEGACPFECCVYANWKADQNLTVYQNERDTSSVAFRLEAGTTFEAVTGNVYVTKPGKVKALKTFTISNFSKEWTVEEGDILYLLNYEGEGYYHGWFRGENIPEVFGGLWYENEFNPDSTTKKAKLINQAETEWWTKVKDGQGREGWINMEKAELSGVDACG